MRIAILTLTAGVLFAAGTACAQGNTFQWPDGALAAVSLTYDDGIDAHLDHAIPDLNAAHLHGTFYVPGHSGSLYERLDAWKAVVEQGHELGNHSIFHPCLKEREDGDVRAWLSPERELERYSVSQMAAELRAMNTTLQALDGQRVRTYAYTCSDHLAGGASYVDAARPLFLAARTGEDTTVALPRTVDLHFVPSWMAIDTPADSMIAFVNKAVRAGGWAVFMFHGVGGGHNLDIERAAHRQLLAYLSRNRDRIWTDTFASVADHIRKERRRLGWPDVQRTDLSYGRVKLP